MLTSKDIAKLANVSQSTVSRVLVGGTGVSAEKRARVLKAIAETGYEPDQLAQNMVQQRTRTFALALFQGEEGFSFSGLVHSRYYFYLHILSRIERETAMVGYEILLPSHPYSDFQRYARSLQARHVAGVLMIAPYPAEERVAVMLASDMPTVFVDVEAEGPHASYVRVDHYGASRQAVEHLIALGHRRIALVTGEPTTSAAVQRYQGYQQTLTAAGIAADEHLVCYAGYELEDAYHATRHLLAEQRGTFTAIMAASDMMAFGVLRAVREAGLRAPQDISVVGSDDIDLCAIVDPLLTTIRPDKDGLAQGAVRLLLALSEGQPGVQPLIVPTTLVVRDSTGPVSASP